jgi:hypothetical protein
MFGKLCGDRAQRKVQLVSTMWNLLDDEERGVQRERELQNHYWRILIALGAQTSRIYDDAQSAWDAIDALLTRDERRAQDLPLLIQEEMSDLGKSLPTTEAAREIYRDLLDAIGKQKDTLAALNEEIERANDNQARRALKRERETIVQEVEGQLLQVRKLKMSITTKIWGFFKTTKGVSQPLLTTFLT